MACRAARLKARRKFRTGACGPGAGGTHHASLSDVIFQQVAREKYLTATSEKERRN
jgi:hypothetical protein